MLEKEVLQSRKEEFSTTLVSCIEEHAYLFLFV